MDRAGVQWLTWSDTTRAVLHRFADETVDWPEPNHVRLLGGIEFDHTFTVERSLRCNLRCRQQITKLAEAVHATQPGSQALLFNDLVDHRFDFRALSQLWAVLRDIIAESTGNPMAALYAPLSYIGRSARNFPLHADLYRPYYLWNVFDRVPGDGSGAATLLPLKDFFDLAARLRVPPEAEAALRSCFEDETLGERFRKFYDLLHVNSEPWATELADRAEELAVRLPFRLGEGYLIHDRLWLHGRETPTGGVTTRRVHRLVFGGPTPAVRHR